MSDDKGDKPPETVREIWREIIVDTTAMLASVIGALLIVPGIWLLYIGMALMPSDEYYKKVNRRIDAAAAKPHARNE